MNINAMKNKNILISGAGIAGPTLAYWLKQYGFNPTVIESAGAPREGGYMIDFWGPGFGVAEKMGIVPDLKKESHNVQEVVFLGDKDKRLGGFNVNLLFSRFGGRMLNILRSSLAKAIYEKTRENVEYIFGNEIEGLKEDENGVIVTFRHGSSRRFDLVVGADGLHSKVRLLTFGGESQFERYYGYYIASYTLDNYLQEDFSSNYINYTVPNKQAGLYHVSKDKLVALFMLTQAHKLSYDHHDTMAQKKILRDIFKNETWECPKLLEKMNDAKDFYFDAVSQIQMEKWSKGRVTLVGDAGYCPSLLSGQGSALAMVGAYILAGELKMAEGDYTVAFKKYEDELRVLVEQKQEAARSLADDFVPATPFKLWVRNTMSGLLNYKIVSRLFWKKYLTDTFVLKKY
jgi:2-polyprenyl-6-methoxyphenol hydroxylase-like FAD-dependent oxidoreductase